MLWCSGAWAWQWTLNGNANLTDEALAVTVDSQGQVVAAGYVSHVDTGAAFTVVKLDRASGVLLWQQTLDGTAHRLDGVDAVRVDRAG